MHLSGCGGQDAALVVENGRAVRIGFIHPDPEHLKLFKVNQIMKPIFLRDTPHDISYTVDFS
jgi:hypothetical protein